MKKYCCLLVMSLILFSYNKRPAKPKILVFTKTAGYRHASIPSGVNALFKLGRENDFEVDTTSDAGRFTQGILRKYAAVVFLSTTGDVLNDQQEAAFERYIRKGGGYAGIHAATDTEYEWPWYGKLAGAYFSSHPKQQEAVLHVVDPAHISTRHLPAVWKRKDEWYNFKNLNPNVHILLTIDEKSYEGGTNGAVHPMSWYHQYEGGRAWYTALGHTEESYSDPDFLQHLLGGIKYAIGYREKKNGR